MDNVHIDSKVDPYRAYDLAAVTVNSDVGLRGRFDAGFRKHRLTHLEHFANPVDKNGEGIREPRGHQTWYRLAATVDPRRPVHADHQVGAAKLLIAGPETLLVRAGKLEKGSALVKELDHHKCYRVIEGEGVARSEESVDRKTHLMIDLTSPADHGTDREVRDRFDRYHLCLREVALLALPTPNLRWKLA